jgi:Icc-related predicted phosphoesterase
MLLLSFENLSQLMDEIGKRLVVCPGKGPGELRFAEIKVLVVEFL